MVQHSADPAPYRQRVGCRRYAIHPDLASAGLKDPADDAQDRGFARAVSAEQARNGAVRRVERNVPQRNYDAKLFMEVSDFDHAYIVRIREKSLQAGQFTIGPPIRERTCCIVDWMRRIAVVLFTALAAAQTAGPEARARQYVETLARRDFTGAQGMFDSGLGAKLSAAALEQAWTQVEKSAGPFRRASSARIESSAATDVVYLTCEFEKNTLDLRIGVDKAGRISGMNIAVHVDYTPPDYVSQSAFRETDVTVGTGAWMLHGSLTMPIGDGPFPGVVLVHGSGPVDRDSTLGPNKPFRDLAWGLASRGVAVLRYNKRTNEYPREMSEFPNLTVKEETVDDALAAVALLRGTRGIDSKRVFVLGHSLGATLAPRIGAANQDIAGLVVLGGTTHAFIDVLVPQVVYNFTLHGPMTPGQQNQVDQLRAQVARANDPALTPDTPASSLPLGTPASYWLDLRGYHPEQVAHDLKQPLLILQGERDYQVTMEDFATWKKGLAGKTNVEFKSYPKLNHMFLAGEGASSDEEYTRPGHVERAVIEDISVWVKGH